MAGNIKLIVATIPGAGECVGLVTGERELFLTSDSLLELVDALLDLNERIESRKQAAAASKKPALRLVGGRNVH